MSEKQLYEMLIIGSGEAGKYLAWTMAKAGRRTAVVERGLIGGFLTVLFAAGPPRLTAAFKSALVHPVVRADAKGPIITVLRSDEGPSVRAHDPTSSQDLLAAFFV